jgi:hypothetical protein
MILIVFLLCDCSAGRRLSATSEASDICAALAGARCNTTCMFANQMSGCGCSASPWACDLYFISTQDYTSYFVGSGYADCYADGAFDCSVHVQDCRYTKADGRLELNVCTAKTCSSRTLDTKVLVGLIVGAVCLFGVGSGIAVWWFFIRGAPVIVLPPAEEEEYVPSSVG